MMRFFAHRRLALVALVLLGGGGIVWATLPPTQGPRPLTAPVSVGDLEETVLASGTIQAYKQVSVGAQVSGQLKSLKVSLGQTIKQGDLVAEIDSLPQQNALREAEAALANIRAQRAAKIATLQRAESAFSRQQTLMRSEASTEGDFETAQATLKQTQAELAALDAQIEQARVSVDTARVNLGYTTIRAPIDGVVVAVVTQEGQTVNANQAAPTLIKLARLDQVTVKAQISEADVVRVKPGQRVHFTILGEPEQRYEARLRAIEPAPDSISDTSTTSTSTSSSSTAIYYNGLFDVPNPAGKLRISMTAEVNIVLAQAQRCLLIPSAALGARTPDGRYSVQTLTADGRRMPRAVRIGLNNNASAQVLDGLRVGEPVVIGEASAAAPKAESSSARRGPPPPMM